MSSSKEFKNHVLEQLGGAQITARSMMGGYCIYAEGKLVGGIYEDRFMLKQTEALKTFVRDYKLEYPYKGSKQLMILIENIDNTPFMRELANHICGCVKNTMSICGTDCSACGFYKSACQGCNQCEGSVFTWKADNVRFTTAARKKTAVKAALHARRFPVTYGCGRGTPPIRMKSSKRISRAGCPI